MEAFYDAIGRYAEAGINDFCFIYSPEIDFLKDQYIPSEDMLRKIALEAIPEIRKKVSVFSRQYNSRLTN